MCFVYHAFFVELFAGPFNLCMSISALPATTVRCIYVLILLLLYMRPLTSASRSLQFVDEN